MLKLRAMLILWLDQLIQTLTVLGGDMNLNGHNIANPVDAQDAVTMNNTDATYVKQGVELDMSSHKITNVAEPTNERDVASMRCVDNAANPVKSALNY